MFALRKLQTAAMLVLCAGAALAFDGGDVFDARELVLRDSAVAKAVGAIEYSDGLPIIAIDESYDRGLAEVRARVAQRYFEQHGDSLDYLIVFTDFDFETGPWAAFATRVKNDVDGVGLPIFDASAQFGSTSGRLQTYIDMAMLDRWEFRHGSQRYNQLLDASVHELMHRWAAHPRLLVNGVPTNDLLGQDGAHWSFWLDSDASLMYGARWAQQSDGRLVAAEVRRRLSNLDLYLAGLMDASEVGPIRLIRDGEGATATATPQLGFVTPGRFDTFAIDDVIGASGPRIPPATEAPRHFKAGLLLLRRPNQPTPPQGAMQLWRYARDLEMRFTALTHGRATLSIANPPKTTLAAAGLPTPLRGSPACPTCGFDGLRARSWLLSQQRQNGAWLDKPAMLPQATAAVLRNLHLLGTETTAAGTAARQFLSVFAARQFEDLRWKRGARVIPATVDAEMLAALDASHGIAGIDAWFAPTAWDLASELDAAFGTDTLAAALPRVLPQLRTLQNADGSFGATPDGRGHLGATAYVLSRLAPVDDTLAETIRAEAIGWLMPQIQGNGQLPGDDHGLITAWLLIGLQDRVTDLAPSLAFLRSHQANRVITPAVR
ncbi:MAG: hypothetical protein IPH76_03365 [Xanthomonadales bacterium]|nr:hypothetical protein [Xanthomonadales bacterium]